MKVPYSWLREMVDVDASPADVAVAMGVRGFAVEGLVRDRLQNEHERARDPHAREEGTA